MEDWPFEDGDDAFEMLGLTSMFAVRALDEEDDGNCESIGMVAEGSLAVVLTVVVLSEAMTLVIEVDVVAVEIP